MTYFDTTKLMFFHFIFCVLITILSYKIYKKTENEEFVYICIGFGLFAVGYFLRSQSVKDLSFSVEFLFLFDLVAYFLIIFGLGKKYFRNN